MRDRVYAPLLIPKIPPHFLCHVVLLLNLFPSLALLADLVWVRLTVRLLVPWELIARKHLLALSALALGFLLAQRFPPAAR